MSVPSQSEHRRPDPAGSLRLIRDCAGVLASGSRDAAPWSDLCRLLVEHVGLRSASLHVGVVHEAHATVLAHAGEHDNCTAVLDLLASQGIVLSPTANRTAKLLVRTEPSESDPAQRADVRKRSFDCLLFPFEWDRRAIGVLHVHSHLHAPIAPETEDALALLTDLLSWRVSFQVDDTLPDTAQEPPSAKDPHAPPRTEASRILAAIPDVVTQMTRDGSFLFVSPSAARVLGHRPDQLTGKRLIDLVHPDDAARVTLALGDSEAPSSSMEYRVRHADGHWVLLEASIGMLDGGSQAPSWVATYRQKAWQPPTSTSPAPGGAHERGSSAVPSRAQGPGTVLVVDDEALVREVVSHMLQAKGYRVLTAVDGPDALRVWENTIGEIDLVITDLLMPGMPGTEVLERLAALRPGLAGIYMSGFPGTVRGSFDLDPKVPFLQKPFDAEALKEALEAALRAARKRVFAG